MLFSLLCTDKFWWWTGVKFKRVLQCFRLLHLCIQLIKGCQACLNMPVVLCGGQASWVILSSLMLSVHSVIIMLRQASVSSCPIASP